LRNQSKIIAMENISDQESGLKPAVLVIDDSRLVRVSIKRILKKEFTIIEAVDGEDGWEKLVANDDIQVVITDAGMPRLDGYQLIERIRNCDIHHVKSIPIMMVTGVEKSQTDIREKALSLGATDFITKPFDDVQILARTRTHAKLDATQRTLEKTATELEETSAVDSLTRISNRRYFLQHGDQALAFATRHQQPLSFIGIGIDNFETVDSKYDEETGNHIQIWLTQILQNALRKEDTLARIDNGLFAVIAPSTGKMDAAILAERMRKTVQASPYTETVISLPLTISLGIVCVTSTNIAAAERYLIAVTQLVKQAQEKGGNRILASAAKQPTAEVAKIPRPNVETALSLLANDKMESVTPFLADLARQVLPLLEACNKINNWRIDHHLNAIKEKLK